MKASINNSKIRLRLWGEQGINCALLNPGLGYLAYTWYRENSCNSRQFVSIEIVVAAAIMGRV